MPDRNPTAVHLPLSPPCDKVQYIQTVSPAGESPFTCKFFRRRHFALLSISLIFLRLVYMWDFRSPGWPVWRQVKIFEKTREKAGQQLTLMVNQMMKDVRRAEHEFLNV